MIFFLFLNTKMDVSEQLKDDVSVGLFVEVCPLLEKNVFVDILFELQLETHLNSIIINCPVAASMEILPLLTEKLKTPSFHMCHFSKTYLFGLLEAIFVKLCKKDGDSCSKLFALFQELLKLVESVLLTSVQHLSDDVVTFTSVQFYHFFKFLYLCFTFLKEPKLNYRQNPIFEINLKLGSLNVGRSLSNAPEKCFNAVIKFCEKIFQGLTLDLWMSWADCFIEGAVVTAQRQIGEVVFLICEIIDKYDISLSEELLSCLHHLRIKPETEEDRIAVASLDDIIANVQGEAGAKWFKALIYHSNVCRNPSAVDCITYHLDLAGVKDNKVLLELAHTHIISVEPSDAVRNLFLLSLRKLSHKSQIAYLRPFFEGKTAELKIFEMSGFDSELTETFNKMKLSDCEANETDDSLSKLFCLCVQSPVKTITKLCEHAAHNAREAEDCVRILSSWRPACQLEVIQDAENKFNVISFVLNNLMNDDELSGKEKEQLIPVIVSVQKEKLTSDQFIETCVLDVINNSLKDEKWTKARFRLDVLKSCLKAKAFEFRRAAMLAFLVQLLDRLSWDWTSFSSQKAELKELNLSIIWFLLRQPLQG